LRLERGRTQASFLSDYAAQHQGICAAGCGDDFWGRSHVGRYEIREGATIPSSVLLSPTEFYDPTYNSDVSPDEKTYE